MLQVTCSMICGVDLASNGVSRAKELGFLILCYTIALNILLHKFSLAFIVRQRVTWPCMFNKQILSDISWNECCLRTPLSIDMIEFAVTSKP